MFLTAADAATFHDLDQPGVAFPRRADAELPFAPIAARSNRILLDTSFYVMRAQGKVPAAILSFVADSQVLHCGVALAEIAVSVGILDPRHPGTLAVRDALLAMLDAVDLDRCCSPSAAAWVECGTLAGIAARTQHGLNVPKRGMGPAEQCCQEGRRRKLLNDALLFVTAYENDAVLVSANVVDMDILLRFRPDARVLLFRPISS